METNGGFLVTKIKQLGDRIFEKILSEKNIDAFNGAQGPKDICTDRIIGTWKGIRFHYGIA